MQKDRILPNSADVEMALIGACLLDGEKTVRKIQPLIGNGKAFYSNQNRLVFDAILRCLGDGVVIDQVSVMDSLTREGTLEAAGGPQAVMAPLKEMATAINAPYHAKLIADDYHRRKIIYEAKKMEERAYMRDDVSGIYASANTLSLEFSSGDESVLMADLIDEVAKEAEYAFENPGSIIGVPTGVSYADSMMGGWQPGEFISIAARPSHGKTALGVWTARQSGVPVYFVSAEMSRRMLGFRMLSGEMGIASHLLRSGNFTEQQKAQMSAAQGRLSLLPIFIEDRIRDIDLVVAECYRMKREHDIGLFIIDYLQLLEPGKMEANANRERQVAKISGLLKQLAKDTDCPVIALCQLNRAIEYSAKRRPPQKSDLRDSGAIEQDLDVLIFLHPIPDTEITEFIIDKNRNGPKGMKRIRFIEKTGAFVPLETIHAESRSE